MFVCHKIICINKNKVEWTVDSDIKLKPISWFTITLDGINVITISF